jgi:putative phosphoesterase
MSDRATGTRLGRARLIGLVADTHGLVRPDIFDALAGVELIFHAGDVGGADVLSELRTVAPVEAVYGNTDPPGALDLVAVIEREVDGLTIHVSHGHELGRPTPERLLASYAADVIVYGHTHRQLITRSGRRLVINPGAAGPRRFSLLPSVAKLRIEGGKAEAEIVPLMP